MSYNQDDIAIDVQNISKSFRTYERPIDRLKEFIIPKVQRIFGLKKTHYFREFFALKDISFQVKRGEIVGVVGRNGAGKSTLLQIICGTLMPTNGYVRTMGRITALLELGSGFNPEFTGRENIYLNASILGLSKDEIDSKIQDIIDFADIGDFIDQPVKAYSSGMYVRLAFSVQAQLSPDILIVDEALSVGDIGFQAKCFRYINQLREKGTTILLVTHSTGTVLQYAHRCIVFDSGKIIFNDTDVLKGILLYEKGFSKIDKKENLKKNNDVLYTHSDLIERQNINNKKINEKRFGSAKAIIDSVDFLKDNSDESINIFLSGSSVTIRFKILSSANIKNVILGISFSKTNGVDIWGDNNIDAGFSIDLNLGENIIEYKNKMPISSGEYLVHTGLAIIKNNIREELDQRRPMNTIQFIAKRNQVGVVYAPIEVSIT